LLEYQGGVYQVYVLENNNDDLLASDGNSDMVVVLDSERKSLIPIQRRTTAGKATIHSFTDSNGLHKSHHRGR
jgi:hypothetical protein